MGKSVALVTGGLGGIGTEISKNYLRMVIQLLRQPLTKR